MLTKGSIEEIKKEHSPSLENALSCFEVILNQKVDTRLLRV
jgi:hypothetical protein